MPAVVDNVQNRLVAMEQHYTGRIGLPAINVVKAESFAFKNRPTGGFLLSAMSWKTMLPTIIAIRRTVIATIKMLSACDIKGSGPEHNQVLTFRRA
jgi:hypothetical protein